MPLTLYAQLNKDKLTLNLSKSLGFFAGYFGKFHSDVLNEFL